MDIQRPSNARAKKIKRIAYVTVAVLACAGVTLALSRLKPAAPSVDGSTIWPDTVKRGPMLREVRGLGTLVPEDIHWIPAQTAARVDKIVIRPGHLVTPDTVILEMSIRNCNATCSMPNMRLRLPRPITPHSKYKWTAI